MKEILQPLVVLVVLRGNSTGTGSNSGKLKSIVKKRNRDQLHTGSCPDLGCLA